jgi:hypothetical protein
MNFVCTSPKVQAVHPYGAIDPRPNFVGLAFVLEVLRTKWILSESGGWAAWIWKARSDVTHGNLKDFCMAIFVGGCQETSRASSALNALKLCPGLERHMRSAAPLALRSDLEVTSHGLEREQQMSCSFANTDQSCGQRAFQGM